MKNSRNDFNIYPTETKTSEYQDPEKSQKHSVSKFLHYSHIVFPKEYSQILCASKCIHPHCQFQEKAEVTKTKILHTTY